MPTAGALTRLARARTGTTAALLCAVHVLLAVPGLVGPTLWIDEAYCAVLARRSPADIHAALQLDSSPPLFYDLLHGWRALFGESEAALRAMSLALSCVVICLLLFRAGRFLSSCPQRGRRAATWAAALWAVSPSALGYAHEVRNYALLATTGLGLTLAVLRYLERGERRWLVPVVLIGSAAAYTHNVAWVLMGALGVAAIVRTRSLARLVPLALAFAVVVAGYVPWLAVLMRQMDDSGRFIGWVARDWITFGPLLSVASWIPGGERLPFVPPARVLPLAVQCVNAAVLLGAVTVAWRRDPAPPDDARASGSGPVSDDPWPVRVLITTIAVYVGALYAMSLFWKPVLLAGRTDHVVLPLLACVVGRAAVRARWSRIVASVIVLQMLVLSALPDATDTGPDERPLTPLLADALAPGDVIVCTGLSRPAVAYVTGERTIILSCPLDGEHRMGQFNPERLAADLDLVAERRRVLERVREELAPGGRLWLVSSAHPFHAPLHAALDAATDLELESIQAPPELGLRRYGERLLIARYRRR